MLLSYSTDDFAIANWSSQAAKDEARYGLKLDGISLVPYTRAAPNLKP